MPALPLEHILPILLPLNFDKNKKIVYSKIDNLFCLIYKCKFFRKKGGYLLSQTNKHNPKYTYFSNFSTTELENLLAADFHISDITSLSIEDLYIILEILSSRKKNSDPPNDFSIDSGWNSFKNDYLPLLSEYPSIFDLSNNPKQPKFTILSFRSIAAIIISLLIIPSMLTITPAQNIFLHIANWTKETFWFSNTPDANEYNDNTTLNIDIENDFNHVKIPPNLLPTWMPDGFQFKYDEKIENSGQEVLILFFENSSADSFISITISYLFSDVSKIYEKDNTDVIIYQQNNTDYYIMNNIDTVTAIWKNNSFECQIDGSITKEELKKIIDSIPSE